MKVDQAVEQLLVHISDGVLRQVSETKQKNVESSLKIKYEHCYTRIPGVQIFLYLCGVRT